MLTRRSKKRSEKKKDLRIETTTSEEIKLNAEEWKQRGNDLFDKRRLSEAASCYSRAIDMKPEQPSYFTNRALCYLREGKWDLVIRDCHAAVQRDQFFVKAYYLLGAALMEKETFDEALLNLHKGDNKFLLVRVSNDSGIPHMISRMFRTYPANEYSKSSRLFFGDEIPSMIRTCRKRRWDKLEAKRLQVEHELHSYLLNLIDAEKERQAAVFHDDYNELPGSSHEAEARASSVLVAGSNDDLVRHHERQKTALNRLFAQADDQRRHRDVPDFLCGRIGFELIRDPVITPCGITYEKKDILEHLRRVGHFDPVTRQNLTQDQLIPNLAMKEVVDTFLAENEWAVDF